MINYLRVQVLRAFPVCSSILVERHLWFEKFT